MLVTTLTKRMAEDLTEYLHEHGMRVRYMHSDVETAGAHRDHPRPAGSAPSTCWSASTSLREGLDIPECALVAASSTPTRRAILRSQTSLVQTIGRAARNIDGRVILYADVMTNSLQQRAGRDQPPAREASRPTTPANGITPESVRKGIADIMQSMYERDHVTGGYGRRQARRRWSATT